MTKASKSKPDQKMPVVTSPSTSSTPPAAASERWNNMLAEQTLMTSWDGARSDEDRKEQLNAILDALDNIAPRDELEGMMVSQMIAAHNAIMESLRRAMIPAQCMLSREENISHANKLMRAFSSLVETYNRYRGKNQQKVVVEHVHVHSGAQAVVGVVSPGRGPAEEN